MALYRKRVMLPMSGYFVTAEDAAKATELFYKDLPPGKKGDVELERVVQVTGESAAFYFVIEVTPDDKKG